MKEGIDQLQQCDNVYAQRDHFVDVHEDKKQDVICPLVGRRGGAFDTHLRNLFGLL
jgi:hypothetical protein